MIIKSMSRKTASFAQLYDYISRKTDTIERICWNLGGAPPRVKVLERFYENARHLPERKNGNILYHEIVSLKRSARTSVDKQRKALLALSHEYLSRRAPQQLAFGRIHIERGHIHCHLMISSNALGQRRRVRLQKRELVEIQREMEQMEERLCSQKRDCERE